MAKKQQTEEHEVTLDTLDITIFLSRVQQACEKKIKGGAFGALTFDQVLALTAKKKQNRINWKDLDGLLLRLVKDGKLLTQNGRYYPKLCLEAVQEQLKYCCPILEKKSSAKDAKSKPRPEKQVQMFVEE